jgi:hypothetical protein
MIFNLGKHPRAMACLMTENEADIMAWLAIIAAIVAITKTGQKRGSVHKHRRVKGAAIAAKYISFHMKIHSSNEDTENPYSIKHYLGQRHRISCELNQSVY